jgi:putative spermidine/putrescine transport system ATP-binding protein
VARFVGGANVIDSALATKLLGEPRAFALRAEDIQVLPIGQAAPPGGQGQAMGVDAELVDVQYHGASSRWQVRLDGGSLVSATRASDETSLSQAPGSRVHLRWQRDDIVLLES